MIYLMHDFQGEHTVKCQELLQLRTDHRAVCEQLDLRESEILDLQKDALEKDEEIMKLKEELQNYHQTQAKQQEINSIDEKYEDIAETERLKAEIRELREELSDMSLNEYGGFEPGRTQRTQLNIEISEEDSEIEKLNSECADNSPHCNEIEILRNEIDLKTKNFENERIVWAQEKEKVLRYQRQLQMNYVQMYRRTRTLESEVENLTIELELNKNGVKKKLPTADLSQTIEL